MTSTIKKVIIIGAGGRLGSVILSSFQADARFQISVLSRTSSASSFPSDIEVRKVADDYPEAQVVAAFQGQDAVISAMSLANVGQQRVLVDAAVKAGVKRFVPSDFGGDTFNEKAASILPNYFAPKLAIMDHLKEKEKDGLTWTAFATGAVFEMCVRPFSSIL